MKDQYKTTKQPVAMEWAALLARGFWERLIWLLFQKNYLPEQSAPRLEELGRILRPFQSEDRGKTRLGRQRDGGYVMLDDFEGVNKAISLGIGNDVSWDLDIARRGIPVEQYDHTVSAAPQMHPLFKFHSKRIAAESQGDAGTCSLTELLREAQKQGQEIILKMDIEGDEWDIFEKIDPSLLRCMRQIVGEFHGFREVMDDIWYYKALRAFANLSSTHAVVHLHGNNIAQQLAVRSLVFPESLEITFVRRDRCTLLENHEPMPGPWDRRNHPARPDISLNIFLSQK
ncbi:MAG: hypothetical protein LV479_11715 [Methylacidiphilales bacterium]|nr:hypothetical protein [Candidatus Methylacidiphilales bacterium]